MNSKQAYLSNSRPFCAKNIMNLGCCNLKLLEHRRIINETKQAIVNNKCAKHVKTQPILRINS